jgi:hypothetical protein
VETLLPNPLTLTLSRRERGPEVTHFRIATETEPRVVVGIHIAVHLTTRSMPPFVSGFWR